MEPVRWGIISTAKIGRQKVVPGMMTSPDIKVLAVASRDEAGARAYADLLGIPKAYGSYEALLADPEIEAVYNPLPNHLHVPMTLAAVRAGKHVLCEKPIAITAAEAEALRETPPGMLVAEAFMVRHHPQWIAARTALRNGDIGTLRALTAVFSYHNVDPANVRNKREIGGGGLLDIGCYPVVLARFLFEAEPVRVVALVDRDPAFGTDRLASAILDFGDGRQASFTVSTQAVPCQHLQVLGTRGRLDIELPFTPPPDWACRLRLDDGSAPAGRNGVDTDFMPVDQYRLQGEAFSRAVRGLDPLGHGIADALANMRVLDALARSETIGGWAGVAAG